MGRSAAEKLPEAETIEPQAPARILKRVPRSSPEQKSAKERALAGTYRVIHGSVIIPKPDFDRNDPYAVKTEMAGLGDEIALGDEDAARMLDDDIVEPLDAKPSRVGKVWKTPTEILNQNTGRKARTRESVD